MQTQNRVAQAEPRLPDVVRQIGLVTQKRSPDLTMVVFLRSVDGRYDSLYLRNYAVIQIKDVLARLQGAGDVEVFGSGDYAMRLWLDPGKIAARNMDVDEVLAAVREQNVQVAAGQIGGQPALPGTQFQYIVNAQGRLQTEQEFENIVVKNGANGETTYLRDVARLELGPDTYALRSMLDGGPGGGDSGVPAAGRERAPALDAVRARMKELAKSFPAGRELRDRLRPHRIRAQLHRGGGAHAVRGGAPGRAGGRGIPADLARKRHSAGGRAGGHHRNAGGAAVAAGFSINSLTLFGLVLATGIVVDDAIVVVENIERKIENGLNPHAAAHAAMGEVTRPIISIMLVLCAVFIPVAFVSGLDRPVLPAIRHHHRGEHDHLDLQLAHPVAGAGRAALEAEERAARRVPARNQLGSGRVLPRVQSQYSSAPRRAMAHGVSAHHRHSRDRARCIRGLAGGYLGPVSARARAASFRRRTSNISIGIVQLPDAASLDRTEKVVRQISEHGDEDAGCRPRDRLLRPVGAGLRQLEQCGGAVSFR